MKYILLSLLLTSCQNGLAILDGATHARGTLHIEGFFTDTQAEVVLCKVPDDYTTQQAVDFCTPTN